MHHRPLFVCDSVLEVFKRAGGQAPRPPTAFSQPQPRHKRRGNNRLCPRRAAQTLEKALFSHVKRDTFQSYFVGYVPGSCPAREGDGE